MGNALGPCDGDLHDLADSVSLSDGSGEASCVYTAKQIADVRQRLLDRRPKDRQYRPGECDVTLTEYMEDVIVQALQVAADRVRSETHTPNTTTGRAGEARSSDGPLQVQSQPASAADREGRKAESLREGVESSRQAASVVASSSEPAPPNALAAGFGEWAKKYVDCNVGARRYCSDCRDEMEWMNGGWRCLVCDPLPKPSSAPAPRAGALPHPCIHNGLYSLCAPCVAMLIFEAEREARRRAIEEIEQHAQECFQRAYVWALDIDGIDDEDAITMTQRFIELMREKLAASAAENRETKNADAAD